MRTEDYKQAAEVLELYAAIFSIRNLFPTVEANRELVRIMEDNSEKFNLKTQTQCQK